jgi:hypothetical protein
MKECIKKIVLSLFAIIALSCCGTAQNTEKINEIVLISTSLDIKKPVIPLIAASVLNGITNSISNEITGMFKDVIDSMRITVAEVIKNEFKCDVIYGTKLYDMPGFLQLKENYDFKDWLQTGDENFPQIIIANDDINPFKFEKGKFEKYFRNSENYKNTIIDICKNLNANYIAVSQTLLFPIPSNLIQPHKLMMSTNFYLFNRDGICLGNIDRMAELPKGMKFEPDNVNSYREIIYQLPDVLTTSLKKYVKKNKSNNNINNSDRYKNYNL